jgi:hypothetical protein
VTDDAFGDGRASKLTFLMYLNGSSGSDESDEPQSQFSGGSTTFFRSGHADGGGAERVIEARAVAPSTGARANVLMYQPTFRDAVCWHVTCDVWRVACDVWRVACDV